MLMQGKKAWSVIQSAMHVVQEQLNIKIEYHDEWLIDTGDYCDGVIQISTMGMHHACEKDEMIDGSVLFGSLVSLGHEMQHAIDERNISSLSFEHKLCYFISDNLPNYYHHRAIAENSYYHHDYSEINAEQNGVMFAFSLISKTFDKNLSMDLLNEYIKTKTDGFGYFISCNKFHSVKDVYKVFEEAKNDIKLFDYSFPSMEQVCAQIREQYLSVEKGCSQLALIVACVYKVRNYEQEDFVNKYGKNFWNEIANMYPDYVSVEKAGVSRDVCCVDILAKNNVDKEFGE